MSATDFAIVAVVHEEEHFSAFFTWDPPTGLEALVENYTISVTPMPVSSPISNVVLSPPWRAVLEYNINHTATIVTANCVEQSRPVVISDIGYGA